MDYSRLTLAHWNAQRSRILNSVERIIERVEAVKTGRVVPTDTDLEIGVGRRLRMAVLFLDICSFSTRPSEDSNEQELVLRTLNLFFTEMIRIAEEYGGAIEKNTGDGLMVYFEDGGGDPPEGGCTRAVASAMSMFFASYYAINPLLNQASLPLVSFRFGIDYGWVTIARVGAARRHSSLVAVGTTANVANKMLGFAEPNEILIGGNVFTNLPPAWRQYCSLRVANTGWTYRLTGLPYPFHSFSGRFIPPW